MSGIEKITITGKISNEPELKYSASGTPVCKFSIPISQKVGGEYKTKWWNITCFKTTAENVHALARKGTLVVVEGIQDVDTETMTPGVYEKDGVYRTSNKLVALHVDFIDEYGRKAAEESHAAQEELPF